MIQRLEQLLSPTGRGYELARDMLTPLIYNIEVKIVLDDSGSMSCPMLGGGISGQTAAQRLQAVSQPTRCCGLMPSNRKLPPCSPSPISPHTDRWTFAMDAMR